MSLKPSPIFTKKPQNFSYKFSNKNYKFCKTFITSLKPIPSNKRRQRRRRFFDYDLGYYYDSPDEDEVPEERKKINLGTRRRSGKTIKYIFKLILSKNTTNCPSLAEYMQFFDLRTSFKSIIVIQDKMERILSQPFLKMRVKYLSWSSFRNSRLEFDPLYHLEKSFYYGDSLVESFPTKKAIVERPDNFLLNIHALRGIETLTFRFDEIWCNVTEASEDGWKPHKVNFNTAEQKIIRNFLYAVLDGYFPNLKTIFFKESPVIYIWLWRNLVYDIEKKRKVQVSYCDAGVNGSDLVWQEYCSNYINTAGDDNITFYEEKRKDPEGERGWDCLGYDNDRNSDDEAAELEE